VVRGRYRDFTWESYLLVPTTEAVSERSVCLEKKVHSMLVKSLKVLEYNIIIL